MAGIAPLNGTPTTTTPVGNAATVPGSITPVYAQPPATPPASASTNFTAFPSSYAGFGTNGSGFGTLSVVNGALKIVDTPAGGLPPANGPAPPPTTSAAVTPAAPNATNSNGTNTPAAVSTAPAPPPPPPPPPSQTQAAATTAGQPNEVPGTATTSTAPGSIAAGTTAAATTGPADTQDTTGAPTASGDPTKTGSTAATGNNNASNPTAGLIGAQSGAIPGSDPAPVNLAQGLLGSPPTNPIVIQADAQEAAAAEAAQQAAASAASAKAAEEAEVEQLQARIAAADATGNPAAAAELQSKVTVLSGQIQGQVFAGLGSTPPQPFAAPAIPPVFLDIAS